MKKTTTTLLHCDAAVDSRADRLAEGRRHEHQRGRHVAHVQLVGVALVGELPVLDELDADADKEEDDRAHVDGHLRRWNEGQFRGQEAFSRISSPPSLTYLTSRLTDPSPSMIGRVNMTTLAARHREAHVKMRCEDEL